MNPLTAYHNSIWLCDSHRLQQIAASIAGIRTCYSRAEVLAARQEDRVRAADVAALTLQAEGSGIDDREEAGPLPVRQYTEPGGTVVQLQAPKAIRAVRGKVGIIDVFGPVDQRQSSGLMKGGGTSLEFVAAAFDSLMSNAAVGAVVLHMDSPGGGVYGTEELATKIFNARGTKPIYSHVDSMACSAGYWIGSAADMMIVTPGGDVGSIGVYALHYDDSQAMEQSGITVTPVSSGEFKTEYFGSLSDSARANLQESVDATHEKFIGAVKRNRGTTMDDVRQNYGRGRVVSADKALKLGMVDRVLPFSEFLAKLMGGGQERSGQKAKISQEVLRMRHLHRVRRSIK